MSLKEPCPACGCPGEDYDGHVCEDYAKPTLRTSRRLRVTIDLPGFFVCPEDTDDDVEEAMALASRQVVVTFIGHEGDSPEKFLRTLEGTLVRIEVAE